jgi:hypothetical protein
MIELTGGSGSGSFNGRTVMEADATDGSHVNANSCWFPGANPALDPEQITLSNDITDSWTVAGSPNAQGIDNNYGYDAVGYQPGMASYIRAQIAGVSPPIAYGCGIVLWQNMQMQCTNGSPPNSPFVTYNQLTSTITSANSTYTCRAGVCVTNPH